MNTRILLLAGVWVSCGAVAAYAADRPLSGPTTPARTVALASPMGFLPSVPCARVYAGDITSAKIRLDGHEDREHGGGDQEHGEHHGEHEHGEHHGDQGDH